eukprot:c17145_g1_i1.p1 GENE.c17145_g1_i1~~c17145_g1_i1.p1  ORF type:complete len:234 (-),score=87.04 c17145_g1_i1:51-752(-)
MKCNEFEKENKKLKEKLILYEKITNEPELLISIKNDFENLSKQSIIDKDIILKSKSEIETLKENIKENNSSLFEKDEEVKKLKSELKNSKIIIENFQNSINKSLKYTEELTSTKLNLISHNIIRLENLTKKLILSPNEYPLKISVFSANKNKEEQEIGNNLNEDFTFESKNALSTSSFSSSSRSSIMSSSSSSMLRIDTNNSISYSDLDNFDGNSLIDEILIQKNNPQQIIQK